jgi:putative oxidoreductase
MHGVTHLSSSIQKILQAAGQIRWLPPLLVRVVIGVAFVQTGWGKLEHLENFRAYFAQLGIPLAGVQAPLVAGLELAGGLLLVLGLGTRLAAVLLSGVMLVAMATAIWPGLERWHQLLGTVEAIYFSTFVYLAVHGAGAISLDTLVARRIGFAAAALRTQTQE